MACSRAALACLLGTGVTIFAAAAYQQPPASAQPKAVLRVSIEGKALDPSEIVPMKQGQSVQLKVERVESNGTATDVTLSSITRYVSTTPWILSVTEDGLVTASGDAKGYSLGDLGAQNVAQVIVTFGTEGDAEIGIASVVFEVTGDIAPDSARWLVVTAPTRTLKVGETVQLRVVEKRRDGSIRDVTDGSTGTTFFTTSESMLVPEPDGRVTCVGTGDEPEESAIVGAENGRLHGSIRFRLFSNGPGPELEVVLEDEEIEEGGSTQIHVYRTGPSGEREEITDTSMSTRYLVFSGTGRANKDVVQVSDAGEISGPQSIGRYNFERVLIFVRNGESVGWAQLRIVRNSSG